jgi:hypothetical protein
MGKNRRNNRKARREEKKRIEKEQFITEEMLANHGIKEIPKVEGVVDEKVLYEFNYRGYTDLEYLCKYEHEIKYYEKIRRLSNLIRQNQNKND